MTIYEHVDTMVSFDGIQVDIFNLKQGRYPTEIYFPSFPEDAREFFPAWVLNFHGSYERLTDTLYKLGFRW